MNKFFKKLNCSLLRNIKLIEDSFIIHIPSCWLLNEEKFFALEIEQVMLTTFFLTRQRDMAGQKLITGRPSRKFLAVGIFSSNDKIKILQIIKKFKISNKTIWFLTKREITYTYILIYEYEILWIWRIINEDRVIVCVRASKKVNE